MDLGSILDLWDLGDHKCSHRAALWSEGDIPGSRGERKKSVRDVSPLDLFKPQSLQSGMRPWQQAVSQVLMPPKS